MNAGNTGHQSYRTALFFIEFGLEVAAALLNKFQCLCHCLCDFGGFFFVCAGNEQRGQTKEEQGDYRHYEGQKEAGNEQHGQTKEEQGHYRHYEGQKEVTPSKQVEALALRQLSKLVVFEATVAAECLALLLGNRCQCAEKIVGPEPPIRPQQPNTRETNVGRNGQRMARDGRQEL